MPTPRPTPRLSPSSAIADYGFAAVEWAQVETMQAFLGRLRPSTGSEALRALREQFPGVALAARVEAMSRYAAEDT